VHKSVEIEADFKREKPTDLSDQDEQEFSCNFDEGLDDHSNDSSEDSSDEDDNDDDDDDDSDFEFKAEKPSEGHHNRRRYWDQSTADGGQCVPKAWFRAAPHSERSRRPLTFV